MRLDRIEHREALAAALPAFLRSQRWFGGKGRVIGAAALVDHAPLGHPGADADSLVMVEVTYTDGPPERYSLWLGERDLAGTCPVVARSSAGPWIVDVSGDRESGRALLRRLAEGREIPTARGGRVTFEDRSPAALGLLGSPCQAEPLGADQSNTSVRCGAFVFKWLRRVQPGESPEVEIGRFLTTHTSFRECAALHGAMIYHAPDGTRFTAGVLQGWIDNLGDGWTYVTRRVAAHLARPGSWSQVREDATALGSATARFHRAMASADAPPALAPAPVSEDEVRRWTIGVARQAAGVVGLLPRARVPEPERAALHRACERLTRADRTWMPGVHETGTSMSAIRIHGDYHLGQTLKTGEGFALIDFEGEPVRPIEERQRRHCALKDVAGMLRSFEYALAVAGGGAAEQLGRLRGELPLAASFLDGYFSIAGDAIFLPADPSARSAWIRVFEIEKALYELEYELNNRPDWVPVPASGLLRLVHA